MKTIPLTQGKVAIVDDSDFAELSKFRWFAMKNRRHWCAGRNAPKRNGKRGTIYMHRQILGFPKSEVDHWDCDGLNNRRSNLRLATDLQQVVNRHTAPGSAGYKGVKRKVHRFEARISDHGRYRCLGHFLTAVEAARAYDAAALKLHGEFAVLNFEKL